MKYIWSEFLLLGVMACVSCSLVNDLDSREKNNYGSQTSCPAAKAKRCEAIRKELDDLYGQRNAASKIKNGDEVNRVLLEINYRLEKLSLIRDQKDSTDELSKLDQKYAELRKILERTSGLPQGYVRPDGVTVSSVIYQTSELQAVVDVMHAFGDLYIDATPVNADGEQIAEDYSVPMPWSGYWYPLRRDEMFGDRDSPLRKFDRVFGGHAVEWEKSHQLSTTESWEGLCGALSVAAVMTKEPSGPVTYRGETFSVSDQKALLMKAYELYPTKTFGIRYNGDQATDGARSDIRPEVFHRVAESFIKEQKKSFIIDDTAGIEVWNKPIYRLRWRITKDDKVENAYLVKAWPWFVRQRNEISEALTSENDRYAPAPYEYRLYVDPSPRADGKYRVIAGEWLGASKETHPDYVVVPEANGSPKSSNPGINTNLNLILSIVGQSQR